MRRICSIFIPTRRRVPAARRMAAVAALTLTAIAGGLVLTGTSSASPGVEGEAAAVTGGLRMVMVTPEARVGAAGFHLRSVAELEAGAAGTGTRLTELQVRPRCRVDGLFTASRGPWVAVDVNSASGEAATFELEVR